MRYNQDPKWIKARWQVKCEGCGKWIDKGSVIFYFPLDKAVFCASCGENESNRVDSMKADESVYNGTGNPF